MINKGKLFYICAIVFNMIAITMGIYKDNLINVIGNGFIMLALCIMYGNIYKY